MKNKILLFVLLFCILPANLSFEEIIRETVHVSVYWLEEAQTDSTPFITADGTHIKIQNYGKLRYCAVSPDLLKRNGGNLKFNDVIYLDVDNKKFRGYWKVKDVMNKRWTKRIDLLVNSQSYPHSFRNAEIVYVNT